MKARIRGVDSHKRHFDFFFGLLLGQRVLQHADSLNATLQHQSLSAAEGQSLAAMTVTTLSSIRTDKAFDLSWEATKKKAASLQVQEPHLPRVQEGSC